AGFLVVAVGMLFWAFWPTPKASMAPINIESGLLAGSVPINAGIVPIRDGLVSTISGGTVTEVVGQPGQTVKANAPLLRLSNADLERQLAEAASELAGAQADYVSQKVDITDETNSRR